MTYNCKPLLIFFLLSLSELEKEVHNIKSGLKALEAVSWAELVSFSLPLVLLPPVIMLLSRNSDVRHAEVFKRF